MNRVAVFVDGDNVTPKQAGRIREIAAGFGRVDLANAYADSGHVPGWLGVDGFRLFPSGPHKNASDILLAMDAIQTALVNSFDTFVIASADGGFVQLAQRLREHGLGVVGVASAPSEKFRAACTEFVLLAANADRCQETQGNVTAFPGETALDRKIRATISAHGRDGAMPLEPLGHKMRNLHQITTKDIPAANWAAYFKARPQFYDLSGSGKSKIVTTIERAGRGRQTGASTPP